MSGGSEWFQNGSVGEPNDRFFFTKLKGRAEKEGEKR